MEITQSTLMFINSAITNNCVYMLGMEGGYAKSLSNNYVNDDDEPMEVFCFWSEKNLAANCLSNEWSDYNVEKIKLSTFLEDWCIGMSNENYIAGLNFDSDLDGVEADPLEFLIEFLKILKEKKSKLSFEKFKSLGEILDFSIKAIQYE